MPPVVPFIPAIAGAAMGAIGGGKGNRQTSSTSLDPQMLAMRGSAWDAAQKWANSAVPGANQGTTDAMTNFGNFANLGNQGAAALGGDAAAAAQFMNPYQQQVLDQMQSRWGDLAANTTMNVGDQATAAGAFGGSRHGVAEGVALSGLNRDMAQQMAGLTAQGYDESMARANQAANLGFGANSQMASIGDYLRNIQMQQDPNYHKYDVLGTALRGMPYGQTNSAQSSVPIGQSILGGAATGAGIGKMGGGNL
jgi:hypothetical protein